MRQIEIFLNSSVAYAATNIPAIKFSELKQLAKKETVELIFQDDWCRITAKTSRKVKVPKKAIVTSEGLVKWMQERILTAWK